MTTKTKQNKKTLKTMRAATQLYINQPFYVDLGDRTFSLSYRSFSTLSSLLCDQKVGLYGPHQPLWLPISFRLSQWEAWRENITPAPFLHWSLSYSYSPTASSPFPGAFHLPVLISPNPAHALVNHPFIKLSSIGPFVVPCWNRTWMDDMDGFQVKQK